MKITNRRKQTRLAFAWRKPGTEEGATCHRDGCDGVLAYKRKGSCSCHINPPCSSCTDALLTCPVCAWEEDGPEPPAPRSKEEIERERATWAKWNEDMEAARMRGHVLPSGGRIFDITTDGRSGSTMVFDGKYEGPVTAAEIFAHLGDGTFGHRGPALFPVYEYLNGPETGKGRFTYTKITD